MNFVKKNYKLIIGIVIGAILISGISVYATGQYLASQVEYNKNGQAKVSDALDDLYSRTTELDTIKTNVNQTTATAADIASGKKAYTKNGLITGEAFSNFKFDLSNYNEKVYKKTYTVEKDKYYIFCKDTYENSTRPSGVTVTGAEKLNFDKLIGWHDPNIVCYLGIIKTTSTTVTFSDKVTIVKLSD